MTDRLLTELRALDVPGTPTPIGLVDSVRAEAPRLHSRRAARRRSRAGVTAAATVLLVAAAFTPAGRATTGWVAELAGIGDPPTLEQHGSVPGAAVVIKSGSLSDGTPYEVVAKRVDNRSLGFPAADAGAGGLSEDLSGVCIRVDYPARREGGFASGVCTDVAAEDRATNASLGLTEASQAGQDAPGLLVGFIEQSSVADVRVVSRRGTGPESDLPVEVLTLEGDLLDRVGGADPVRVFVAQLGADDFIDLGEVEGADVSQQQLDQQLAEAPRVDAIAYDSEGAEVARNSDAINKAFAIPDYAGASNR